MSHSSSIRAVRVLPTSRTDLPYESYGSSLRAVRIIPTSRTGHSYEPHGSILRAVRVIPTSRTGQSYEPYVPPPRIVRAIPANRTGDPFDTGTLGWSTYQSYTDVIPQSVRISLTIYFLSCYRHPLRLKWRPFGHYSLGRQTTLTTT